jgi:formate hydrogenlyase transcriptional activator
MSAPSESQCRRILIVDDEPLNLDLLRQEIEIIGYEIDEARDGHEALRRCGEALPDLILLDIMMPGMDGLEVCRRLKAAETTRDTPVIFMTALSEISDKVAAFAAGGVDYVTKPFQAEEVLARVRVHVELRRATRELAERNQRLEEEIESHRRARQTIEYLREEIEVEHNFDEIIGAAPALQDALSRLEQVAKTDATVLIQGETGTGKELFARAIHDRSARSDGALIKVNCAALPHDLIESELFGHEEGAFTGATRSRKGRFELADNGTLFLDEVGELSPAAQAKLLRVLQEHELERVGGTRSIAIDVRVIAATNKDLLDSVQRGVFRDDLFYRLNVFPIQVPALRERAGDVALLARHLADVAARRLGKEFSGISSDSQTALERYAWPGNIRELQNVIERAAILSKGPLLYIGDAFDSRPGRVTGTLEDVERAHITNILAETRWQIEGPQGAANQLGLNPSTLRGKMRKLGIEKGD